MAKNGYIGRVPGDSSVIIARKTYEPTGIQTDFTFTAGYQVGYCDVYVNGVRLIASNDYTAQNGSTVGLTSYANSGDIVEIIAYKAFNIGSVDSATANFDIGGNLDVTGVTTGLSAYYTGVVTASSFSGDGSNLTNVGMDTGYINATSINVLGITTSVDLRVSGGSTFVGVSNFSAAINADATTDSTSTSTGALIVDGGVGIAKNVYIGAGLSVAGTLTYEDVTNVDSVGVVTAKSGVNITGGQLTVGSGITMGIAGVATFSGTGDIHLLDNVKLNVGDGSDLQVYHNGSHSYTDNGTGSLFVRSDNQIYFQATNGDRYADFVDGGAVKLYYSNAAENKKFETTNDGTVTTGIATATGGLEINADSKYLKIGAGGDLQLFHNGTNSLVKNTTGDLVLESDSLKLRSATGESFIQCTSNGSVDLRYDDSLKLVTTNDGVVVTGIVTTSAGVAYTGLLREAFAKTDGKLSDNTNIDLEDGMVHYFTTTESTTSTPNLRWNSSFSLNNKMNINDAITVTIITSAAAAGYSAQLTIDGSAVTEQWVGGAAPSAGGADGYDIYTYNILKTASATFLVIGNLVNAT